MTVSLSLHNNRCKKSATYFLIAFFLVACQPPTPDNNLDTAKLSEQINTPLIIDNDSVTMSPDHILNIKSSRYQPSLGLQGKLEPAKQQKMIAKRPITIDKVMVKEGEWVEKGAPLFVVHQVVTQTGANIPIISNVNVTNKNGESIKPSTGAMPDKDSTQDDKVFDNTASDNKASNLSKTSEPDDANNAGDRDTSITDVDTNKVTDFADTDADTTNINDKKLSMLITVRAKTSGYIGRLFVQPAQTVEAGKLLLEIGDKYNLHFIATLPLQAEPQLSIGQTVAFTAKGSIDTFAGQISKIDVDDSAKHLLVYVHVINDETSREQLTPGMMTTGRVNYGQIEVGTIVPKNALHDVDLSILQTPPYQSIAPLTANIWIITRQHACRR